VYPREKLEEFVQDLELGVPVTVEAVHQRKDGSAFPVEIRTGLIDVHGEPHILSLVRDITERKRAEQEIEGLARFPSENPNPVLRIATDGTLLYANAACTPLLDDWGWGVGQPVATEWRDLVGHVLASGEASRHEAEHRDTVLSFEIAPVQSAGYANAYGRNITERKRAENALARETEINAAIAELAGSLLTQLSIEDVSSLVLDCAKRFTDSPFGFVGYIEPATGHLVSTTMTRDIWDM